MICITYQTSEVVWTNCVVPVAKQMKGKKKTRRKTRQNHLDSITVTINKPDPTGYSSPSPEHLARLKVYPLAVTGWDRSQWHCQACAQGTSAGWHFLTREENRPRCLFSKFCLQFAVQVLSPLQKPLCSLYLFFRGLQLLPVCSELRLKLSHLEWDNLMLVQKLAWQPAQAILPLALSLSASWDCQPSAQLTLNHKHNSEESRRGRETALAFSALSHTA